MFIISGITIKENKKEYYAIDNSSGGYPYWTSFLTSAKMFKTIEEASKPLCSEFFTRIQKMSDEDIYPPTMLNQMDMGSIRIEEIVLSEVKCIDFKFIKKEYLEKKDKADKLKEQLRS